MEALEERKCTDGEAAPSDLWHCHWIFFVGLQKALALGAIPFESLGLQWETTEAIEVRDPEEEQKDMRHLNAAPPVAHFLPSVLYPASLYVDL